MSGTIVPKGWCVEPEDPSVGIFGDFFWHDACQKSEEIHEAGYTTKLSGYVGNGINRYRIALTTLVCPDCGKVARFQEKDWDPEDLES
jgi:hypothetical protein